MEATALNRIDTGSIPKSTQIHLCTAAAQMADRHRDDPGYRERFEKWKAGQNQKTA